MKKLHYIAAAFAVGLAWTGCTDVKLPDLPATAQTELDSIPLPEETEGLVEIESKDVSVPLLHAEQGVYALHTQADFDRIKRHLRFDEDPSGAEGDSPWAEGWARLRDNRLAQATTTLNIFAQETIIRGEGAENYMSAARAAARAYQLALRWKIEDNDAYARIAVDLLNEWASTTKALGGNSNVSLASGIYGHEFAIAGEILRSYKGWASEDFKAYQDWMLNVWYPVVEDFLVRHHGTNDLHYWANWGLCNIAATLSIGILTDRRDIYNAGIEHFQTGATNGRITHAIYYEFPGTNFAQLQESGRDQGHTLMCVGLLGTICQLAYNQGDDFFAYRDNLFLKACEYAAAYNYANVNDLPYMTYIWQQSNAWGGVTLTSQTEMGADGRGGTRPIMALPYYHYSKIKNLDPSLTEYTEMGCRVLTPEGGGDNYGDTSGGYDALGFGTLMYARDDSDDEEQ